MAKVEKLKERRCTVERIACAYKRLAEQLEAKYAKVKGSNVDKPLVAKFKILNNERSGWLGIEYTMI